MDPVCLIPIDREWVEEREAALIAAENEMFRAARDRALTDEERRYWEEFIKLRADRVTKQRVSE